MIHPHHSIKYCIAIHKNEKDLNVLAWKDDHRIWTCGKKGKWYKRRSGHQHTPLSGCLIWLTGVKHLKGD